MTATKVSDLGDLIAEHAQLARGKLAELLRDVGFRLEATQAFQGVADMKGKPVQEFPLGDWLPPLERFANRAEAMTWLRLFSYWNGRIDELKAIVDAARPVVVPARSKTGAGAGV